MKKVSIFLLISFLVWFLSYAQPAHGFSGVEGKKISLDIKGMDIIDVLKLFSMQSGLNIVAGKNVRGVVTIFLKDVDVANAFEIIIAANELAYEKDGDIINVMTERDYEVLYGRKFHDRTQIKVVHLKYGAASDVAKALNEIKSRIGKIVADERSNTVVMLDSSDSIARMAKAIEKMDNPVRTQTFALNYAIAKDIEPRISELVTKGTGQAKIDERTNTLIVTDTQQKIEEIKKIISSLDSKTKEVLIEAKIIEVTLSDDYKMGVDWKNLLGKEFGVQFTDTTFSKDADIKEPFVLGELASGTLGLDRAGQYEGLIKALKSVGKTDVLSTPHITVVNNQEAKILVGTKEPFLTSQTTYDQNGQATVADQVTFVDVGIKLSVTPTINEKGFITMKIKPEVSSAVRQDLEGGQGKRSVPVVTSSEAETSIMIRDGATMVMAGLMKDKVVKNSTKVPILGDLPLLGMLFRSKTNLTEKTELVILLTPHILSGEESGSSALAKAPVYKEQTLPEESSLQGELGEQLFPSYKPKPYSFKEAEQTLGRIEESDAYNEYYLSLSDRLMQYVARNYIGVGTKGEVQVFFTLKSDGSLLGEPVVVGKVDPYLKKLAIQCVKSAGPYPRFPLSLSESRQTFNILLSFSG